MIYICVNIYDYLICIPIDICTYYMYLHIILCKWMYWSIGSQKKNIRESHLITNCVNFLIKRFFIEISNYNDLCTLQEINIPHLGKRKMIFKRVLGSNTSSQESILFCFVFHFLDSFRPKKTSAILEDWQFEITAQLAMHEAIMSNLPCSSLLLFRRNSWW